MRAAEPARHEERLQRQARILDLALLPSRILSLQGFLSWAVAGYWILLANIIWLRLHVPAFRGPWVLNHSCNLFHPSCAASSRKAGAAAGKEGLQRVGFG